MEHPYPMCQVVQCLSFPKYNQIIYEAVTNYFDCDHVDVDKFNLYSLLINAEIKGKWLEKYQDLIQRMINADNIANYNEIPLILYLCNCMELLREYKCLNDFGDSQKQCPKRVTLYLTFRKKSHMLGSMSLDDVSCANQLTKLIELIDSELAHSIKSDSFNGIVSRFEKSLDPTSLTANQSVVHNEIKRVLNFCSLIYTNQLNNSDGLNVQAIVTKYSILDALFKFERGNIFTSSANYSIVRKYLENNFQLSSSINANLLKTRSKTWEVYLYDQFYAVQLWTEMIFTMQNTNCYDESSIQKTINEIKQIINGIDDSFSVIETIESLYTLIFLRWEYVDADSRLSQLASVESLTTLDESDTSTDRSRDKKPQHTSSNVKIGFLCVFKTLSCTLEMLNDVINRHHSIKNIQNEPNANRLLRISKEIQSAIERFTLIHTVYGSKKFIQLPKREKQLLNPCYYRVITQSVSSSEDDSELTSYSSGKRIDSRKRKHKYSVKYRSSNRKHHSTTTVGDKGLITYEANVGNKQSNQTSYCDNADFISKMLSSKNDLIAICMCQGDLIKAKSILEVILNFFAIFGFKHFWVEKLNEYFFDF